MAYKAGIMRPAQFFMAGFIRFTYSVFAYIFAFFYSRLILHYVYMNTMRVGAHTNIKIGAAGIHV